MHSLKFIVILQNKSCSKEAVTNYKLYFLTVVSF